jgi:hypothetical protein
MIGRTVENKEQLMALGEELVESCSGPTDYTNRRALFIIPGEPVPKGRPRVTKRGVTYTPKKFGLPLKL